MEKTKALPPGPASEDRGPQGPTAAKVLAREELTTQKPQDLFPGWDTGTTLLQNYVKWVWRTQAAHSPAQPSPATPRGLELGLSPALVSVR